MIVTKPLDLGVLAGELTAAGVTHRGLGRTGNNLYTYTATGLQTELPAGAQPVVDAHNAATAPIAVQTAADNDALADFINSYGQMRTRLSTIQSDMQTILNGPATGTLASLTTAVKLEAQALKDLGGGLDKQLLALAALKHRMTG